ncbi:YkvA family protein [Variovorax sp. J2P1-59]|uniref:YkvA family protein n=1 Tax=Variovorax flavidus TaxID=3053501 RepID=UPI0025767895|nr:YkvA family protein [Variovorax sp. J2P1-59]MDM0073640.1 YkvA family protein [Variovorax sp. J2P1-59]
MSILQGIREWARRVKRDAVTLWFACKHPGTSWIPKLMAAFVVAYALSPIDLIPDFIPVLGYIDDALLLPALIWLTIRMLPADVLAACRIQADQWLRSGNAKPRSAWGAALVVAIWIGVTALVTALSWAWLRQR